MNSKEIFNENLKISASHILAGVENDFTKASEVLEGINKLLSENPKFIRFISNEENRKEIASIKIPKNPTFTSIWALIPQFSSLNKKLKES